MRPTDPSELERALTDAAGRHGRTALGTFLLDRLPRRLVAQLVGYVHDCRADLNADGVVNSMDFILFLNAFTAGDPLADYNGDGVINSLDFVEFLNDFVTGC